jgi:hypothetical protein
LSLGVDISKKSIEDINDALNSLFIPPPFLIKTPSNIFASTGLKYMTCIRTDNIKDKHPLLDRFFVSFFTSKGDHYRLIEINCENAYKKDNHLNDAISFLVMNNNQGYPQVLKLDSTNPACEMLWNLVRTNISLQIDIMRIPYTFQRQRPLLFKLYAEHVTNIIYMLSLEDLGQDEKYNRHVVIAGKKSQEITDLISLESKIPPYQMLSIIDTQNQSHMYGNSRALDTNLHVDFLENIINLTYTPKCNKPIVTLPYTQTEITRQYQYSQVLARMLFRNIHFNNIYIPKGVQYNVNDFNQYLRMLVPSFQDYYKHCFGQDMFFTEMMFSNIHIKIGDRVYDRTKFGSISDFALFTIYNQYVEEAAILADVFQDASRLSFVNAPIILKEIWKSYVKIHKLHKGNLSILVNNPIYNGIKAFMGDIMTRIRIVIYLISVYYRYFMDYSNSSANFQVHNSNSTDDPFLYNIFWSLDIENFTEQFFDIFSKKYHITIHFLIYTICPHGIRPQMYQYNFGELNKEIYLLKYIKEQVSSASNYEAKLEACNNAIKECFYYYNYDEKNDPPAVLTLESSTEESLRVKFEYLLKANLIELHQDRMIALRHLENIMIPLFDNRKVTDISSESDIPELTQHVGNWSSYKASNGAIYKQVYDNYMKPLAQSNTDDPHKLFFAIAEQFYENYEKKLKIDTLLDKFMSKQNIDIDELYTSIFGNSQLDYISSIIPSGNYYDDRYLNEDRKARISNIKEEYVDDLSNERQIKICHIFLYACYRIDDFNQFVEKTNELCTLCESFQKQSTTS